MTELETLRQEIDSIDRELVALFLRRRAITSRVGVVKHETALPIIDPVREGHVLRERGAMTTDPAAQQDVVSLFRTIMTLSRAQQEREEKA